MLLVPFRTSTEFCNTLRDEREMENFPISEIDFDVDFSQQDLLFSFDFDELLEGIQDGEPDKLSNSSGDGDNGELILSVEEGNKQQEDASNFSSEKDQEGDACEEAVRNPLSPKECVEKLENSRSKNFLHGKRKLKVDWTPELHRRFVQAVEELGVEKAVPSKILERMGIHCLTRHNIASHLQKYRSHRKHLVAKEAKETVNCREQRRQIYGCGGIAPPPIMGFPPLHPIRPLHVWGHPTAGHRPIHTLHNNKKLSPLSAWLPTDLSYWRHFQSQPHGIPGLLIPPPGLPLFPKHISLTRYSSDMQIAGITPPPAVYGLAGACPLIDPHPSKESIDAVIGDAISKPWLPLPLGLNPPSTDSVLDELQRHANQAV